MKKQLMGGIACSLFSTIVLAHPGHDLTSAYAGFTHPFLGLDHLLMMLAIGVWAAKLSGALRWQLPATFIGFMAVGAGLGFMGLTVSSVETAIAASVISMGVLLVINLPIPAIGRVSIVAVFATMHGLAHGLELLTAPTPMPNIALVSTALIQGLSLQHYSVLVGMLLATALLHGIGFIVGSQRHLVMQWFNNGLAFVMLIAGGLLLLN